MVVVANYLGRKKLPVAFISSFRSETSSVCICAYQKAVTARLSQKIEVSARSVKLLERLQVYASLR